MESMLASEAEYQLADAIDTNEIAKRQFIRDPHLTKKSDQTVPGEPRDPSWIKKWLKGEDEERRPQGLNTHF